MNVSTLTVGINADISGLKKELDKVPKLLSQSARFMHTSLADMLILPDIGKKLAQALKKGSSQAALATSAIMVDSLKKALQEVSESMTNTYSKQSKTTTPVNLDDEIARYGQLQSALKKAEKAASKLVDTTKNLKEIGTAALTALQGGIGALGQSIGQAVVGKSNPFAPLYKSLQSSLKSLGGTLIKIGLPMLIIPGMQGEGLLYEAGGIALEAVAGTMNAIKMASGGIVSGSTLVNVGEYAGAAHNPEVIAPLDKLHSMLPAATQHHTFEIQGDKLVSILQRVDTNNNFALGQ